MAEKEKYIINIQGECVEVSPDIYQLYIRLEREDRAQEDRVQRHEVSYDALDNGETVGAEMFADEEPTPEEQTITNEIHDMLHRAIASLPRAERELIQAIYFDGLTELEYAIMKKTKQQNISYKLLRTLSKMRKLCNVLGSF